jgi:hypothetical protein
MPGGPSGENPFRNIIIRPGHSLSQWVVRTTDEDNRNQDRAPSGAQYGEADEGRANLAARQDIFLSQKKA